MKRLSVTLPAILMALSAAVASAEPLQKKSGAKEGGETEARADQGTAEESEARREGGEPATRRPPEWLRVGRSAEASPETAPAPTTLPPDLFGRARFALPKGGEDEEREGIPLGDDESWKVQATQIGLMVGGFAALTALCQGGGCMLPKGLTGWLPDPLKAKPYQAPQIDQPSEYRKSR